MKRLYRLTPHHHLTNNPLFELEVRRVRWGTSAALLLVNSGRRLALICCVLLIAWLLLSLQDIRQHNLGDFVVILLALSFLASLALDYSAITSALGTINDEVTAGRWDLLRLTLVTIPQIIAAKHGLAQVRAWRLMITIIAVRVAVLLIGGISLLLVLLHADAFAYLLPEQARDLIIEAITGLVLALLYIVEPFWRMRTVTALGVAISARARQPISALLAAGGAIFALWLLQGLVLFTLFFLVASIILPLALLEYTALQTAILSPLIFLALVAATVYGFYAVLQTWSLRRARRWIGSISE